MDITSNELDGLISTTATIHQRYLDEMHNGRDLLLEYNSCRTQIAHRLVNETAATDDNELIEEYMEQLFDCYGIDSEIHSANCTIIRPSESKQHHFPELNEEGMTITTDRETALANEDISFINWEHPMISAAMEMVLSNELGNSTLSAIKHQQVKPGTLLLETIFIVETAAQRSLHTSRYLPSMMIRVVVDPKGRDYTKALPLEEASYATSPVNTETSSAVINSYKEPLKKMLQNCEAMAGKQSEEIIQKALSSGTTQLQDEINRLEALSRINPTIREEEITFFKEQLSALQQALGSATIRLDAQRVLVGM
jgi:ATP-dependent helicase HepA